VSEPFGADRGEQRLAQQGVPGSDPVRIVWTAEREIDIAQDAERLQEQVIDGVSTSQPPAVAESTFATQVCSLAAAVEG
jgi:hypothetical protein